MNLILYFAKKPLHHQIHGAVLERDGTVPSVTMDQFLIVFLFVLTAVIEGRNVDVRG